MRKNILITGGLGFIGSNFIDCFYKNHDNKDFSIINLDKNTYAADVNNTKEFKDNKNYSLINGDICNTELVNYIFEKYNITDVINFAAESHVDNSISNPAIFIKSNVQGVCSLLDISKKYWKDDKHRFIQISTDEVFGSMPINSNYSWKENDSLNPRSPYSASKASAEHLCMSYFLTYKFPIIITRSSNNFGPKQNKEKFIPTILSSLIKENLIPVYGNGSNIRDWIYVEDNCSAIDLVFQKGKIGNVYNIGAKNEISNINLVKIIIDIFCNLYDVNSNRFKKLISFVNDRKGHDLKYSISIDKIINELNWTPPKRNLMRENIIKTINWYQGNATR